MTTITPTDTHGQSQLAKLLAHAGIQKDPNLDHTVGIYNDDYELIATGSCFGNTLRCLAVHDAHQGEGLMARVVSHLQAYQLERGNRHTFLYTKASNEVLFRDLGFYPIVSTDGVVLMENMRKGFSNYLAGLGPEADGPSEQQVAALVMNCNPFTLGHQHLVEKAARENDRVHLFVVEEDLSVFSFETRYALIQAGTAHLTNVVLHTTGSYMVSQSVFPSYFFESEASVVRAHTQLDLTIFARIANYLGIQRRYVGEEPYSQRTDLYNQSMEQLLPGKDIELVVVPRLEIAETAVSASHVRRLLREDKLNEVKSLVPVTTWEYLNTSAGQAVAQQIRALGERRH